MRQVCPAGKVANTNLLTGFGDHGCKAYKG